MPTLKDVAKEAGLTVSTVSRVLNNRGYISDDARRRVSEAMQKLNYRPNELARSLQNQTSTNIGVIVPHIRHPYFSYMIDCLEAAAHSRGYRITLFNSQGREDKENEIVEMCSANRLAGIILCAGGISENVLPYRMVPMVAVERPLANCAAAVSCDNRQGGVLAARRLIDAGCREIAYVGGVRSVAMPADERMTGFREVCEQEGICFHIIETEVSQYRRMEYEELIAGMFEEYPQLDGVFASSDVIGAQVIRNCYCIGRNVPGDVKVVGFDDINISRIIYPAMTTVHQPIREIAEKAVELLCRTVNGETVEREVVFPVELVERDSVSSR